MVATHKESNLNSCRSYFESSVVDVEAVKANGIAVDTEAGPWGLGGDILLTYKRRKTVKVVERGKVSDNSVGQVNGKSMKHFHNLAKSSQKDEDSSDNRALNHKRNIILDQIYQSLDGGSLKKCIQSAHVFPPGSSTGTTPKEYITFTERCSCTFSDVIMSEQFAQLCSLLLENFEGVKADKLFDLSHINTRMKEKSYDNSPFLFQSDILEIWAKLQKIGSDITALARCLSDKTLSSFTVQVGNPAHSMSEGAKHEFMHTKPELTETCAPDEAHTCRCCREKADGKNVLVCDSCEEMYHISCIEPAVKEIPTRSWYCANCTAKGTESSHENCIACERLNAYMSPVDGSGGEEELENEGITEELEESSNELGGNDGDGTFQLCRVCKSEVSSDEDYRICGHSFCSHKFYHAECLTAKQLISHGPCWYCPSCLCRICLTDVDDDKIVLCDGCDHAYHIYCMQSPCSTIPKGKWFCQKCDNGIQHIQRARRSYENMQNASKNRASDGKLKGGTEALNKSGGVDMLLNAAQTLNNEENLT